MIETNRIDRNLQVLNGVQNNWGLPALPDMTKLDLASMDGLDHNSLASFATGIASDLHEATAPRPIPVVTAPTGGEAPNPNYSVGEQVDRFFAGIANKPTPTTIDVNGVTQFKERAKRLGYLDQSTPSDGTWYPELNRVRWQMLQDDYDRHAAGNRPGAVSLGGISKFIGDWMSPSGLLDAATKLKVLPDLAAVADQSRGFMKALGDFVSKPSAGHFAKLFTDNPLDDLLIPVVNDVLLLTGVGEVWGFARVGMLAAEGAELATAAEGIYGGSKFAALGSAFRSGNALADVERFKEASALSQFVSRYGGGYGEQVANAMTKWRSFESVGIAKKSVQVGMRLGLAQKAEGLLPGESTGFGVGDIPGGRNLQEYVHHIVTNPLTTSIGEALFTPPSLLEPGTFSRATKAVGAEGLKAAEAVGPHLPGKLAFARVAEDQLASASFYNGIRAHLSITDPAALTTLEQKVSEKGVARGLADHLFGGDTEDHLSDLGQSMSYVATAAGMEALAAAKADARYSRTLDFDKWNEVRATFRNKYIAQLRTWDPEDVHQIARAKASIMAADSGGNATRHYRKLLSKMESDTTNGLTDTVDRLRSDVENHNAMARGFGVELLNNAVRPGVLENYLPQVMDSLGDWSNYVSAQSHVRQAVQDGLLDEARYLKGESEAGRRLSLMPAEQAGAKASPSGIGFNARQFEHQDYMEWNTKGLFGPLARPIDPSVGTYTVAKLDTPTKQEFVKLGNSVRSRQKLLKDLRVAERTGIDNDVFPILSKAAQDSGVGGVHQLPNPVVDDLLAQNVAAGGSLSKGKNLERTKRIIGFMRRGEYGDLASMRQGIEQDLRSFDNSTVWSDRYGIESVAHTPKGLQPVTLDDKVKALYAKSRWVAAEVGMPDGMEHVGKSLADKGYKLVHGVEYLLPSDLAFTQPFADLTDAHLHRITLGNWFSRQDTEALGGQVRKVQRLHLQQRLAAVPEDVRSGLKVGELDSADLDTVLDSVRSILDKSRDAALTASEDARGVFGKSLTRVKTSWYTPFSMSDLGHSYNRDLLVRGMREIGYTPEVASATWQALKDAQNLGFQRRGLVAIEDHLRNQPVLLQGLGVLGNSAAGDQVSKVMRTAIKAAPIAATAAAGAAIGDRTTDGSPLGQAAGALAGGVAGMAGLKAAAPTLAKVAEKWSQTDWLRYAYLPDELAHIRDTVRFGINPFFDLRRYVKNTIIGQTIDLPEGVHLGVNQSRGAFIKKYGQDQWDTALGEFRQATRGKFDFENLEDTERFFTQTGLLGYNPTEWMASTFGHLRAAGMDGEAALAKVKKIYAYGTTGRSAMEQSANFVFFPFSFEKKVVTTLGRYLSQDLSRAVMIHDSMKMYDTLDQNYDLHSRWRKYLPMVDELRYLNPLDHGFSLGELGGVNRPMLDFFLPMAMHLGSTTDSDKLKRLTQRMVPFWGEARGMFQNLGDQGNVLFSPAHMAKTDETDAGFAAARQLRDGFQQLLESKGTSWGQMMNNPDFSPLKAIYEGQMSAVLQKYPAYASTRAEVAKHDAQNSTEMQLRIGRAENGNGFPEDDVLLQFSNADRAIRSALSNGLGINLQDDPDKVPPEVYNVMRQQAITFIKQVPDFKDLYKRFYARTYGPITRELV